VFVSQFAGRTIGKIKHQVLKLQQTHRQVVKRKVNLPPENQLTSVLIVDSFGCISNFAGSALMPLSVRDTIDLSIGFNDFESQVTVESASSSPEELQPGHPLQGSASR